MASSAHSASAGAAVRPTSVDNIDVSIVLTGRNDNYGGDFTVRCERALRFNWDNLSKAHVNAEVVFVEWNPVAHREYLVQELERDLPEIPPVRFRRYVVDAGYQAACSLNVNLQYLEYVAKNVGVRRARGPFVLVTNTDIFFSRGVVEALACSTLHTNVVYRAARIDLALGSDQSRVTWEGLDDANGHARRPTLKAPLYAGASGDFMLAHRTVWHQLRGFNEVYRLARAGVDHNFLVKAYGCGYQIEDILSPVYHVNHEGSYRISKNVLEGSSAEGRWGKRQWPSRYVVYDNADSWGLAHAPVREIGGGAQYLDFDWAAVPAVAELRRVVTPLRRAISTGAKSG